MNPPGNPDQSDSYAIEQLLPEPLPEDPLPIFKAWFDEAQAKRPQPNPSTFALATIDEHHRPSARMVLCKGMDLSPGAGYIVFYTNYSSTKAQHLEANPRAAALFHWDHLERQVRIEGPVVRSPDAESIAYFNSRPLEAKIGAWASDQSKPIESRDAMLERVVETLLRFDVKLDDPASAKVPRPEHWGGYRIWAEAVELWVSGPGRVHDRARWSRELSPEGDGFKAGPWSSTRLQP